MEVVFTVVLIVASFTAFAVLSYFLVKVMFPKIENDDWEERYLQIKKNTERFQRLRNGRYNPRTVH